MTSNKKYLAYLRRKERQNHYMEGVQMMTEYNWTLLHIEDSMGIPHSTLHLFITKYLPTIDEDKYNECIRIMYCHKHEPKRRKVV